MAVVDRCRVTGGYPSGSSESRSELPESDWTNGRSGEPYCATRFLLSDGADDSSSSDSPSCADDTGERACDAGVPRVLVRAAGTASFA